jgi:hypothetical protein
VLTPVTANLNLFTDANARFGGAGPRVYGQYGTVNLVNTVSGAGDVNDDGYADVLLGGTGRAYLVLGPVGRDVDLSEDADVILTAPDEELSVAAAGDVDGDGLGDLLVGHAEDTYAKIESVVYLLSGPLEGALELSSAQLELAGGSTGAGAGDFDGDGNTDLVVASEEVGRGWVVTGPVDDDLSLDPATGFIAAQTVAGAGDVNGDTFDDVIGGYRWTDGGRAYLILGRAP